MPAIPINTQPSVLQNCSPHHVIGASNTTCFCLVGIWGFHALVFLPCGKRLALLLQEKPTDGSWILWMDEILHRLRNPEETIPLLMANALGLMVGIWCERIPSIPTTSSRSCAWLRSGGGGSHGPELHHPHRGPGRRGHVLRRRQGAERKETPATRIPFCRGVCVCVFLPNAQQKGSQ